MTKLFIIDGGQVHQEFHQELKKKIILDTVVVGESDIPNFTVEGFIDELLIYLNISKIRFSGLEKLVRESFLKEILGKTYEEILNFDFKDFILKGNDRAVTNIKYHVVRVTREKILEELN